MSFNFSERYKDLTDIIRKEAPFNPEAAIILGSGLGDFADSVKIIKRLSTRDLPGYPESTVEGHEGSVTFAEIDGKNVLLFKGRLHFYEGYKIHECLLPVFIASVLKVKNLIVTNAAGGIGTNLKPGDLMLVTSFSSLFIKKELESVLSPPSIEQKNNITSLPSPGLTGIIRKAAIETGVPLKEGGYWYTKGPCYETPAEIEMISRLKFEAVGMSTVHEIIFAGYLGLNAASISCITNYAAGINENKLSHDEVIETADKVKPLFEKLVKKIIQFI